jgi:hypothetical protein
MRYHFCHMTCSVTYITLKFYKLINLWLIPLQSLLS